MTTLTDAQLTAIAVDNGFGIAIHNGFGTPTERGVIWFDENPLPLMRAAIAAANPEHERLRDAATNLADAVRYTPLGVRAITALRWLDAVLTPPKETP